MPAIHWLASKVRMMECRLSKLEKTGDKDEIFDMAWDDVLADGTDVQGGGSGDHLLQDLLDKVNALQRAMNDELSETELYHMLEAKIEGIDSKLVTAVDRLSSVEAQLECLSSARMPGHSLLFEDLDARLEHVEACHDGDALQVWYADLPAAGAGKNERCTDGGQVHGKLLENLVETDEKLVDVDREDVTALFLSDDQLEAMGPDDVIRYWQGLDKDKGVATRSR